MANENLYSPLVGSIYLFNLLLGTGVLTMPAVFENAGYISGIICLTLLCLISYVQTTFLIESMANANFVKRMQQSNEHETTETSSLLSCDDNYDKNIDNSMDVYYGKTNDNDEYDNLGFTIRPIVHTNSSTNLLSFSNSESDERQLCPTVSSNSINTTIIDGNIDCVNSIGSGVVAMSIDGFSKKNNLRWSNVFRKMRGNHNSNNDNREMITKNIENCLRSIDHIDQRFQINEKFELGNMTELFLNRYLSKFFFVSIIVYLFGDLLIYNSMMSKSLRDISCTSQAYCNATDKNDPEHLDAVCWDSVGISRHNAYRIFLLGFIAILGPLTYAKLQKTKIIQIGTIILRWMAFLSMIGITIKIFVKNEAKGKPRAMDILNVPKLFGICVYSFMCHHSVPSIITPIRNKKRVFTAISIDYILVLSFYVIIALTAIFAFGDIQQVYTLNFQVDKCSNMNNNTNPASISGFDIFLPTFPIFTLFSSYTILALTLINNMKVLVGFTDDMRYGHIIKYSMPLIAIIPPLVIALFTEDISSIVQYVGSYSGTLIQYVFPTLLAYYSRRYVKQECLIPYIKKRSRLEWLDLRMINIDQIYRRINPFVSFFQSQFWIYLSIIWLIICIFLVTLDRKSVV